MKLKRLLKMIDFLTVVKIIVDRSEGEDHEEEEIFKGFVLDVPWCYANYKIDETASMESIFIHKPNDEDDDFYIGIYVIENDD